MKSGVDGVGSCAQERGGPGPEVVSPEEGTGVPQLMWAPPSGFWPGHTHVDFSVDSVRQMGVSAPGATSRVSWAQGGVRAEESGAEGRISREHVAFFGCSKGLFSELTEGRGSDSWTREKPVGKHVFLCDF